MMSWAEYVELADLIGAASGSIETVTPMRDAVVIRLSDTGQRETKRMRWGFVPAWAKNPATTKPHIHARAEEIETKKTFAPSFFDRRGLVVVRAFNEGQDVTPTKRVQHVITPRDGKPIAIAVIWDRWGEPHAGELLTFAMVTVAANTLISPITDRMPAIVSPEDWSTWLGEVPVSVDELKAILKPFEGDWDMQEQGRKPRPPKTQPLPGDDSPSLF